MKSLKVVLIGAGSASFGRGTLADLLSSPELREFDLTIRLVDIDEQALARMTAFARLLKEHYRSPARIEATTDRLQALPGADYVIASVASRRWDMWEKDYYVPLAFGFRHTFGENGGPGAAFHTLRSLHLMIPICRDIERFCPDALLLNYTNPESRVCLAISRLTRIACVGLCHGPLATAQKVAEILERPVGDLDLIVGGINHFHWVLRVNERAGGRDLYPELRRRLEEPGDPLDPFSRALYGLYGYFPFPDVSHAGEYLPFTYEIGGPEMIRWGIGPIARKVGATAADREYVIAGRRGMPSYELWCRQQGERIDAIASGREALTPDAARPTDELAIPIICDIELDRGRTELAANVPNAARAIANLPEDAIVEVPVFADANGVRPVPIGPLPEGIAAACSLQLTIQSLLVEAYRERSKLLLLQALLMEPVVDSLSRAREMMETMLRLQQGYLPELR